MATTYDFLKGTLFHKHKYGDISDPTSSGYLGVYATLTDLQTAYPTANAKDYAFVAGKIYKYASGSWGIAYETGGETPSNFRDYVMLASGSNPLSGNLRMFAKTIKRMFTRDSSGVEAMVCDDSGWQPEFQGIACDGVDDYISIADNANLNFPATPFMQEFFVKMPSDVTTMQTIFYKGTNGFSVAVTGGVLAIAKNGVVNWSSVSITQYAGKLLHGIAGWDGTNRLIYLNGQLVQSAVQSTNLIETTTTAQSIGVVSFKGSIYLARFWNLALTATEVLQLYNNGQPQNSVILSKYRGASQIDRITNAADREFSSDTGYWTKVGLATISGGVCNIKSTDGSYSSIIRSGLLVKGKAYIFKYNIVRNAFGSLIMQTTSEIAMNSTVGVNKELTFIADGVDFVIKRNGVTDIDIDNVSIIPIGCVLELKGENMGHVSAIDTSGNRLHGAMNGTPALTVNPLQQKSTTGVFTTNIAAGTASKDIIIPANYYVSGITVTNTLASGNLTNVQAVLDPASDNITLISGKTINNGKTFTFTSLADQTQSITNRTVRINATGNGTGGMEVMLILARRD